MVRPGVKMMGNYVLMRGTRTGVRVVSQATGETATVSNRLLDNMTQPAAEEAVRLLERRDALRQEHMAAALARNDLVDILQAGHDDDDRRK